MNIGGLRLSCAPPDDHLTHVEFMRRPRFTEAIGSWVLLAAACGTSPSRVHDDAASDVGMQPECAGETFEYRWTFDGAIGESGCLIPRAIGHTANESAGGSLAALEIQLLYLAPPEIPPRPPIPFCGFEAIFDNTPFVNGSTGSVSSDRWAIGGDGQLPNTFIRQRTASTLELCRMGGEAFAVPTGGTWHVIQGGTLGEIIEVEFRDVSFEPVDGHELTYDYIRWRVRLPDSLMAYP